MDDLRTQETLDALADLFLTGTTPSKPTPPVRTPPRKAGEQPTRSAADLTPKVVVTNDVLDAMPPAQPHSAAPDQLEQSAAARSTPAPILSELDGPSGYSLNGPRKPSDYESAPAPSPLKLRAIDTGDAETEQAPQAAHVEAVFLGNLPGFGGPWLTQYAFQVAQQRGPVAVLHVIGDRVDLELVTAERQNIRPGIDDPIAPGSGANADALIHRLDRLASDAGKPVSNWLIHLPSPTDPTQLPRAAAVAHWTILCGGDDMAVAGATRLLQTMLESAEHSGEMNRLTGVMIMGSDEAKAREAIDKFNAAAVGFLRQPVELIGSRKQMTPVHMRPLGGCSGPDIWDALQLFLSSLPSEVEADATTAAPAQASDASLPSTPPTLMPLAASPAATLPAAPSAPDISPPSEIPVYDHAAAVMEPPSEIDQLTQTVAPSEAQPSTSPRSPRAAANVASLSIGATRDGAPVARPASPAPSSISDPDLSALLTASGAALAGGVALQARYPRQPDTQILLDQNGRLHLLRRQITSDLRAALVDLMEARDWLREHLDLVALTQRQCRFDTAAEPTLHLFTSDAKNAVAMVTKLGPSVKLHLLQEVRIGSARTWVCTELN